MDTDYDAFIIGTGVAGSSLAYKLKKAGIEVKTGVLKDACMDINLPYEIYVREKRPFVILKTAISLDGKIATEKGDSKWITSKLCRD